MNKFNILISLITLVLLFSCTASEKGTSTTTGTTESTEENSEDSNTDSEGEGEGEGEGETSETDNEDETGDESSPTESIEETEELEEEKEPEKKTVTISGVARGLIDSIVISTENYTEILEKPDSAFTFEATKGKPFILTVTSATSGQSCSLTQHNFTAEKDVTNVGITCGKITTVGDIYIVHPTTFHQCVKDTYGTLMFAKDVTHIICITCSDLQEPGSSASLPASSCVSSKIDSLQGIESYANLEMLSLPSNDLTSVDLFSNPLLTNLDLSSGKLNAIALPTGIKKLNLSSNLFNTIPLTGLSQLEELHLDGNDIETISTANNRELTYLDLRGNSRLRNPGFTSNTKLAEIHLPAHLLPESIFVSGVARGVDSEAIVVSLNGESQIIIGNTSFQFATPKNNAINLTVAGFSSGKICQIDRPSHLGDEDVNGVVIRCHDKKTVGELSTSYTNQFIQCVTSMYPSNKYADEIESIVCENKGIISTEGLEHFISLTTLRLDNNLIESINLENKYRLEILSLNGNKVIEIDVTKNYRLRELNLSNNNIETIDLTGNWELQHLNLADNKSLKGIDLSQNTQLTYIELPEHLEHLGDNVLNISGSFTDAENGGYVNGEITLQVTGTFDIPDGEDTWWLRHTNSTSIENSEFSIEASNPVSLELTIKDKPANITCEIENPTWHKGENMRSNQVHCTDTLDVDDYNNRYNSAFLGGKNISACLNTHFSGTQIVNEIESLTCKGQGNGHEKTELAKFSSVEEFIFSDSTFNNPLNLTRNFRLKKLEIQNSSLATINLSNNRELEYIDLKDNRLTSIDLTTNTEITHLNLQVNSTLSGFSLTKNDKLADTYLPSHLVKVSGSIVGKVDNITITIGAIAERITHPTAFTFVVDKNQTHIISLSEIPANASCNLNKTSITPTTDLNDITITCSSP